MIAYRRLMLSGLLALVVAILTFVLLNNLFMAVLVFIVAFAVSLAVMSPREKTNQPKIPVSSTHEAHNEEQVEKTARTSDISQESALQAEQQVESTAHAPEISNEPAIQVEQQIEANDKDAVIFGIQLGEHNQGIAVVKQQVEKNEGEVVGAMIGKVGADNQKQ
jgi:hypothetical protein